MDTYDQMMVDNRYPGDFDTDKFLYSKQQTSNKDEDGNGSLGRRVYLESPSFDNKEEEDMYRYVPSRITDRTSSIVGNTIPTRTAPALMDSLDFDLDILGTNNARSELPYRQSSKPLIPPRQLSNMPRTDPRQDPLLGPLLAELDAMSNQQQLPPPSPPIYQQNPMPYQSSFVRPIGSSPSNHALTNIANRTVNDALLDADLYDSLEPKNQQQRQQQQYQTLPVSAPHINQTRPTYMDGTEIFAPSSYTNNPNSFLSHFGPEDQLFQRPLLNTLGQNYVPNPRPPQQREITYNQTQNRVSPPQRTAYVPPTLPRNYMNDQPIPTANPFIEYQKQQPPPPPPSLPPIHTNPSNDQDLFFTDHTDDQIEPPVTHRSSEQQDQDSRRQAVWNELHRTNVKVQEKNAKKHESANRNKAPFGSSSAWNGNGSQQSSALSKSPQRHPFPHPPPMPKSNYIEENIDMIKNKENFYHRYPSRKYENSYARRKDLQSGSDEREPKLQPLPNHLERKSSLPVTFNLNPGENPQNGSLPTIVTIPLDSHVNRVGDKISVNIDLRLVDLQNLQQQQQQQQHGNEHPNWSSGDPLDRHIRKLERNIEHTLPTSHPPQRSPVTASTGGNASMSRYAKPATGLGRGGYNPPVYGGDYYNYNDKGREEDSYLAKLNYARKNNPQFKPYTGRDYEQFKKNYGFGTGHLGYDFDNTTHKEKMEKAAKTRQYAQQIEARNKKKISELSRRTLSDTRLPKASRPFEYPPSAIHRKQLSGKSTYSSPAILNEITPYIPAHRPTEVLYRRVPTQNQLPKLVQHENKEIIEEEQTPRKKPTINPIQKRREERLIPNRTNQQRLSLPKPLPPTGNNKRRPVRFDNEPSPQQQPTTNQDDEETRVMNAIRQELTDRPLNPNEELIIVEQ